MKESRSNTVLICTKCGKLYPSWESLLFCEDCNGTFVEVSANPEVIRDMIRHIREAYETTQAG